MAQMQILERRMAAQPDNADLLAQHDALPNIVDAADGYHMDVNIKKVLSGMGFAQDTWQKNIAVLSGGCLLYTSGSTSPFTVVLPAACVTSLPLTYQRMLEASRYLPLRVALKV